MKPIFWESWEQAAERLNGTYVLYGDTPCLVAEVRQPERMDEDAKAVCRINGESKNRYIPLSDPLFHRFRKLPKTGWVNSYRERKALYLERRPYRGRSHGLSDNNVTVGYLSSGSDELYYRDIRFRNVSDDEGWAEANQDVYPTLQDVFPVIKPDSTIAVSNLYAIHRDKSGMRWLYRNSDKVGTFSDVNTLLLFSKYRYLTDELNDSSAISVENIKEF